MSERCLFELAIVLLVIGTPRDDTAHECGKHAQLQQDALAEPGGPRADQHEVAGHVRGEQALQCKEARGVNEAGVEAHQESKQGY